jgi:hypothetical protein
VQGKAQEGLAKLDATLMRDEILDAEEKIDALSLQERTAAWHMHAHAWRGVRFSGVALPVLHGRLWLPMGCAWKCTADVFRAGDASGVVQLADAEAQCREYRMQNHQLQATNAKLRKEARLLRRLSSA